jgi:hypothetical protein
MSMKARVKIAMKRGATKTSKRGNLKTRAVPSRGKQIKSGIYKQQP